MACKFANNARSTLSGSITDTATTFNVAAGDGVLFPDLGAGDFFALTFSDSVSQVQEIVYVTAKSGDTMTCTRGEEGFDKLPWSSGAVCANLITAGTLGNFLQTGVGLNTSVIYEGNDISNTPNVIEVDTLNPRPGGNPANGMIMLITLNQNYNAGTQLIYSGLPGLPVTFMNGSNFSTNNGVNAGNKILLVNDNNAAWRAVNFDLTDAPSNSQTFGRANGSWVRIAPPSPGKPQNWSFWGLNDDGAGSWGWGPVPADIPANGTGFTLNTFYGRIVNGSDAFWEAMPVQADVPGGGRYDRQSGSWISSIIQTEANSDQVYGRKGGSGWVALPAGTPVGPQLTGQFGQIGTIFTEISVGAGPKIGQETQDIVGHPKEYYGGSWQDCGGGSWLTSTGGDAEGMEWYQRYI